jgi:hypothetical protein
MIKRSEIKKWDIDLYLYICMFLRFVYKTGLASKPCLLMDQNEMSNRYRGPSIDASYQVSYHLAKQFQRKSCLWWPCLLTDWDKLSNLYKRTFHRCFLSSFGSFGHVVSEEKIFRNKPIRNKNCLWLWKVLYSDCSFHFDPLTNMAATGNSCFRLVAF